MGTTIKTTVSMRKSLLEQIELVTQQLNISSDQLFEMAVERFIENYPEPAPADTEQFDSIEQIRTAVSVNNEPKIINQGDIFWIRPENHDEAELGYYPHPYVVIQDNLFNHGRIHSVVICALTSNMKQANAPGNVLLEADEANLPKQSAVVVSKVSAINKSQLGEYIGSLNEQRIKQILAGIRLLQSSFFAR